MNKEFFDMEPQIPEDRKTVRIEEVKNLMSWVLHTITKEVIESIAKEMIGE